MPVYLQVGIANFLFPFKSSFDKKTEYADTSREEDERALNDEADVGGVR